MRTPFTISVVCSAPFGATVLGSEIPGPPGCDSGAGGSVKRCCSRPGCTLDGIACATAGLVVTTVRIVTAVSSAKVDATTNARAAIRRKPPAAIRPNPKVPLNFLGHAPGTRNCFQGPARLANGISGGCFLGATGHAEGAPPRPWPTGNSFNKPHT